MDSLARNETNRRGRDLFDSQLDGIRRRTDGMFARLMAAQWLFGIVIALWVSPIAWAGAVGWIHVHLWAAIVLGAAINSLPVYLALTQPGRTLTRHVVAIGQVLTSALLIHLTGGRIETHFHVFGSLAVLAFYRDEHVLVTALAVVMADHGIRGIVSPASVYGVAQLQPWRFLEHAGWVLFEDAFLIGSVRQGLAEMRAIAERQAELEWTGRLVEEAAEREAAREIDIVHERERLHNQFLANISHDLRTPIASIKGYAETLRRGGLKDRAHRLAFVQTIEKNAERIARLVENLLDLVKLDGKRMEPGRSEFPLSPCVSDLIKDFRPQAKRNLVRIRSDVPKDLAVHADSDHFWQILQNLLSNAVKFSPRKGEIVIRARREGGEALISVADQGPGIPAKELSLIFERFHSRERGGSSQIGTGLGLAIAKGLVELNRGRIAVRSSEGSGAVFTFSLPLAETGPT